MINDPGDLGCRRRLQHLDELKGRAGATPHCSILNVSVRAASSRVQPSKASRGPPTPRMAGGPRPYGSATLGSRPCPAPCAPACSPSPASPTKRACAPARRRGLLDEPGRLRPGRLRVNGLITRIPGRNRCRLTSDGLAFAIFSTKVHDRLLRPLLAAGAPPAPPPIRNALRTIDIHITQRINNARMLPTATSKDARPSARWCWSPSSVLRQEFDEDMRRVVRGCHRRSWSRRTVWGRGSRC